ncbi:unnamed protein product [Gadus morhua 'NCC']
MPCKENPRRSPRTSLSPPATAQHGPYSLMFRPKGGRVLSFALHLCSAASLCLSDQHAFISSPVMNSEGEFLCDRAGGGGVLVPDDRQLLEMASVLRGGTSNVRGEGGPHQDILDPGTPSGGPTSAGLWAGADAKSHPPVWEGSRLRAQGRRPRREEARRPSSANVPDKMDRKNRLVYPLPLRTLKRVPVALRMSVSSVQSL